MIRLCSCANAFQDAKYGKGLRVMTRLKVTAGRPRPGYRCAVCGKLSAETEKEKPR